MHYPYLAVFWNPADDAESSVARRLLASAEKSKVGWNRRFDVPGGAVFETRGSAGFMTAYSLGEASGLLFGRLFRTGTTAVVSRESLAHDKTLSTLSPSAIANHLVNSYWGAYVAFAADSRTSAWIAIRDCSGMIPCFMATISGVSVFFSDFRHLLELHATFTVNWKYLTAFISWPHLQIRDTALLDVQEVLAGEIVVSSPTHRRTDFAWNPISICESEPFLDAGSARIALLETTQQSVGAWSSVHHRLLHRLSGGFDSAAVLGAIMHAESHPQVVCVNQYGNSLAEDERRYARCAASLYDLPVIEVPWDHSGPGFDARCLTAPITPKPTVPYIVDMLEASFWNEFCQEYGCDGITTGQGGDHIFMSPPTIFGVPDCLWLHGLGSEFLDALRDATFLTGQSLWHVLSSAIWVSVKRGRFPHYAKYTPNPHLLRSEAIFPDLPRYILPPWCLSSGHLAPGKRYQVLTIAEVVNRHRPMPDLRNIEELHPLLSQPLLSAALRIPLHLLYTGGRKRGLARDAFREYLPQEILTRETKGHTGAYILGLVRKSLPFVRQMLLDGTLVRSGVLSRDILAQYLNPDEPLRAAMIFPILASISAELWVLRWFGGAGERSRAGPDAISLQPPHLCLATPDARRSTQAQPG